MYCTPREMYRGIIEMVIQDVKNNPEYYKEKLKEKKKGVNYGNNTGYFEGEKKSVTVNGN